tara:strand:- start:883 stop:1248 length:366 start_codon:yes stop_codon:yes gene_type:complete
MKSRSRKNKGVRLQNWTRDLLLSLADHLEPDDISTAIMGESGEDIKFSPSARVSFPFSIECKNVERIDVWGSYAQAKSNAGKYEPVLVFKKNGQNPKVMVDARYFFNLVTRVSCEETVLDN